MNIIDEMIELFYRRKPKTFAYRPRTPLPEVKWRTPEEQSDDERLYVSVVAQAMYGIGVERARDQYPALFMGQPVSVTAGDVTRVQSLQVDLSVVCSYCGNKFKLPPSSCPGCGGREWK